MDFCHFAGFYASENGKCPKPSGQAFRHPLPSGQCPNVGLNSWYGPSHSAPSICVLAWANSSPPNLAASLTVLVLYSFGFDTKPLINRFSLWNCRCLQSGLIQFAKSNIQRNEKLLKEKKMMVKKITLARFVKLSCIVWYIMQKYCQVHLACRTQW